MEKNNEKIKLCISIPTHDNRVYYEFMKSFTATVMYLDHIQVEYIIMHRVGSLINRSRNQLVSYFLASDCSHLIFLDSDIYGFEHFIKKMVDGIRDRPHEIPLFCGGIYPIKEYNWERLDKIDSQSLSLAQKKLFCLEFNINLLPNQGYREILQETARLRGLLKVRHVPSGCMFLHRNVFLTMIQSYPNRKYQPGVNEATVDLEHDSSNLMYNFFDSYIHDYDGNRQYLSEDYGFCQLWSQTGGEVYAETSIPLGHQDGGVEYYGSYLEKTRLKVDVLYRLSANREKKDKETEQENTTSPASSENSRPRTPVVSNSLRNTNSTSTTMNRNSQKIILPGIPENNTT